MSTSYPPPLPPQRAPAKKTNPAVWALIGAGVLLAIAVGSASLFMFATSGIPANEAMAIRHIRTIQTAQLQHKAQFGRFASKLDELQPRISTIENGYRFVLYGGADRYFVWANPIRYGITGRRSFFADQTMAVRQNRGPDPASIESEEVR
jgi:hypothetical protein